MKRKIREKRIIFFSVTWIYTIGFLMGILALNFGWKEIYMQREMTSAYFLLCLTDIKGNTKDIMEKVISKWGGMFLVTGLCGLTIFGALIVWVILLMLGFEMGSILACSILQFGFKGGIFGISLFFPQYILYLPVMFGICILSYQKSIILWKNQILFQKSIYRYLGKMMLLALLLVGGILMEGFWNPIFVCKMIDSLKIFS